MGIGQILAQRLYDDFADRLEIAVYDINEEHRMGEARRIRLAERVQRLGSQSFMPTEDELAPLPNPWTQPEPPEREPMSITGLQSGAFKEELAKMKQKLLDEQMQGLAQINGASQEAAAKIQAATSGAAAKIKSEVEDAMQEFAEFTNGGPA
jgi:hypothetical protein